MSKKSKQSSIFERLFDQEKNEFPGNINKTVSPGTNNLNNNTDNSRKSPEKFILGFSIKV